MTGIIFEITFPVPEQYTDHCQSSIVHCPCQLPNSITTAEVCDARDDEQCYCS